MNAVGPAQSPVHVQGKRDLSPQGACGNTDGTWSLAR